jgi:hypothetical protein
MKDRKDEERESREYVELKRGMMPDGNTSNEVSMNQVNMVSRDFASSNSCISGGGGISLTKVIVGVVLGSLLDD